MGLVQAVSWAVGPWVRKVQKSAANHNGGCTYAFSQMEEPIAGIIGASKVTQDGICEMLSARWVIENANNRSFSAWIQSGGLTIDVSKIRLLMQTFIIGNTMGPMRMVSAIGDRDAKGSRGDVDHFKSDAVYKGAQSQSKATANYLKSHGVSLVDQQPNHEAWRVGDKGGGEKIKHGLATAICEGSTTGTNYRMIGVWGHGGGHAMAAWKGTTIHYFDPNFGEFRFPSHKSFKDWFVDSYYPKSFYTTLLGNRYEVHRYQKA